MIEDMALRTLPDSPVPGPVSTDRRELSLPGLLAVLGAVLLPVLSFFSVSVALGPIGSDLDASPAMLQLVVAGYGVPYASLVVLGGRIGDGRGRRRLMIIGLVGFVVASIGCGLAQTPEQLVAARVLQGVAAAFTTPQVLATIHATTTGERRGRAVGMFGATAGIATCLAFLVGGPLTSSDLPGLGWRAVFWLNVPVALVVIWAVLRWVPPTSGPARVPIDLRGTVLLAAMMVLLVLPVTEGRAVGWPPWTWVMLAAFVPVALAFVWSQRRSERNGGLPLVPPSLLRLRTMAVGLAVAAPFFGGFGGFMFVYAYAAQGPAGMSPWEVGISLTPLAVAFLAASLQSARMVARFGVSTLTVGALLAAAGYAVLALQVAVAWPRFDTLDVLVGSVAVGVGQGLLMPQLFGIILSQVPPAQGGLGSGVLITAQQMMFGLGAALVGSLYLSLGEWGDGAGAFATTTLLVAVILLAIAVCCRFLDPRRSSTPSDLEGGVPSR
jgi:MFS family permease